MTVVILIHTLIFLVFWLTNLSFLDEVNDFLGSATGLQVNIPSILLLISVGFLIWCAIHLFGEKNRKSGLHWVFALAGGLYILFFYASFIILFIKNPIQLPRLGQLILYFRIFFDTVLLGLFVWKFPVLFGRFKRRVRNIILPGIFMLLFLVPVFLPPGSVFHGSLPVKPLLVAHRGASVLAPENTRASMQVAADLRVYGLEADITISYDGQLFLMHDPTLERTTNIAEVYPSRLKERADYFTWDELQQLDAGQWFTEKEGYLGEKIPKLTEILNIVKENDLHFIYDLRIPFGGHPYANRTLALCLAEIKTSGVASRTWILASPEEILFVRTILPDAILAKSLDYKHSATPRELVADGYQLVNSEYGLSNRLINSYKKEGLWVNLWTVDEPWQYSRLWLVGANSVTTNNIQTLLEMTHPVLAIPYLAYILGWGAICVLAAFLMARRRKVD